MLFVTVIYFLVSRKAYSLTMSLRGMLLPDDLQFCLKSLLYVIVTLASFCALGGVMTLMGMDSVFTICFVSLLIALVLERKLFPSSVAVNVKSTSSALPKSKQITLAILVSAVVLFRGYTSISSTAILPLPDTCQPHVAKGAWFFIDNCDESNRANAHYTQNLAPFAVCGGATSWAWEGQPARSHCRFARRDKKQLSRMLHNQAIVFVGDSIVRNVFYSISRLLGDGKIETEKHGDIERTFGTTTIAFRWAPQAKDQIDILDKLAKGFGEDGFEQGLSMVVMGNGLWDALDNKVREKLISYIGWCFQN